MPLSICRSEEAHRHVLGMSKILLLRAFSSALSLAAVGSLKNIAKVQPIIQLLSNLTKYFSLDIWEIPLLQISHPNDNKGVFHIQDIAIPHQTLTLFCMHHQDHGPMRSLFLDDIPGARPAKRVYDKSSIRVKHNEEIYRFGTNLEQRYIDWYSPPKRNIQPLEKDGDDQWRTKRTLQNSFTIHQTNLSKSQPLANLIKTEGLNSQPLRMQKSSILTGSGRSSLGDSPVGKNPYFPHRYVDPKMGETNKWSGQRSWAEEPTSSIHLTSTKEGYFRNWS